MKRICITAFGVLVSVLLTVLYFKAHTEKSSCEKWVEQAKNNLEKQQYAAAIDTLTPYVMSEKCRAADQPQVYAILKAAMVHVPSAHSNNLAQTLRLSRMQLSADESSQDRLALASAYLVNAQWQDAINVLKDESSIKASFILLAAAHELNDEDLINKAIENLHKAPLSDFQKSYLSRLGIEGLSAKTPYDDFAAFLIRPNATYMSQGRLREIAASLSGHDLSIATSLLSAKGHGKAVITLLDQPERQLSPQQITRLARLMWREQDLKRLNQDFLDRKINGKMPGEIHLIVCLASLVKDKICDSNFDAENHTYHYGQFASDHWHRLLTLLSQKTIHVSPLIDALNMMTDLLKNSPVISGLKAVLFQQIGEKLLAEKYTIISTNFGYTLPQIKKFQSYQATDCQTTDLPCFMKYLSLHPSDLKTWHLAADAGMKLSLVQANLLQENSPNESLLWRKAKAQALMNSGTQEHIAKALNILRGGLAYNANDSLLHLLASDCYAFFKDYASYQRSLAAAVRIDVKTAVTSLRMALYHFSDSDFLSAEQLIRVWEAQTYLEVSLYRNNAPLDALLIERLSLLAGIGQSMSREDLAEIAYRKIITIDKNHHIALNNLAFRLGEKGENLDRALAMAQRASRLSPSTPAYQDTVLKLESLLSEEDHL